MPTSNPHAGAIGLPAMRTTLATLLGAGAVMASSVAHAGIVWSGPVNLAVPATTAGLYLNVVTGANANTPGSAPGWDINPWSSTALGFFNPAAPAGGAYVLSAASTAANLALGDLIDATDTFGSGISTNIAQWTLNSSNNLLGFRFINENNGNALHYGWARLQIGGSVTTRSIVEYAYESVAATGIGAGQTGAVPLPATHALVVLALGLMGLQQARRRGHQA